MRPLVRNGEVFAAIEADSKSPDGVRVIFYRAEGTSPAGKPLVLAVRLEESNSQPFGAAVAATMQQVVPFTPVGQPAPVLGVTVVAYLGIRQPTITIEKAEMDAVRYLATTGHLRGGFANVRPVPIGAIKAEEEDRPSPLAVVGPAPAHVRPRIAFREVRQEGAQIRALLKKEWSVAKSSKCTLCCAECCFPMLTVFIFIMALLFTVVVVPVNRNDHGYLGSLSVVENSVLQPFPVGRDSCLYDASATSVLAPWSSTLSTFCQPVSGTTGVAPLDTLDATARAQLASNESLREFQGGIFYPSLVSLSSNPYQSGAVQIDTTDILRTSPGGLAAFISYNAVMSVLPADVSIHHRVQGEETAQERELFSHLAPAAAYSAIVLLLGLIPSTTRMAALYVDEKREGFREHLRVMGGTDFAYVVALYSASIIRTSPVVLLITILCRIVWYKGMDVLAIWAVLQSYVFAMTGLCAMMPAFFTSSTWAMVVVITLTVASLPAAPFSTLASESIQWLLAVLIPPINGWYGLAGALSQGVFTFPVHVGAAIGLMIMQGIVLGVLSQYLSRVLPGPYGVPLHPLYFLRKPQSRGTSRSNLLQKADDVAITLKRLRKCFDKDRASPAVDLSLDVRAGEILALLGHNGAGKTTTIAMLTGTLEPTDYETATVGNFDVTEAMDLIRINIGLCPQHDVLFPSLGAREHLELFAALRGVQPSHNRLDDLLMFLDLPLDSTPVSQFSGGMKRRVSVACALVGDPAIVYLDEPTTGLDEVSRRKLWELLKMEKGKGRTMLLTTHMMEEAEYLGDRIAIMSAGSLHSLGTAPELKEEHGSGYYLVFTKAESFSKTAACDLVQKHCSGATMQMDSGSEVTIFLPLTERGAFGELLQDVEEHMSDIGAKAYGLNMSTLEDVFVQIAEETSTSNMSDVGADQQALANAVENSVREIRGDPATSAFDGVKDVSQKRKVISDVGTVFLKRLGSLPSSKADLVLAILVPVLFISLAFVAAYCRPGVSVVDGSSVVAPPAPGTSTAGMRLPTIPSGYTQMTIPILDGAPNSLSKAFAGVYIAVLEARLRRMPALSHVTKFRFPYVTDPDKIDTGDIASYSEYAFSYGAERYLFMEIRMAVLSPSTFHFFAAPFGAGSYIEAAAVSAFYEALGLTFATDVEARADVIGGSAHPPAFEVFQYAVPLPGTLPPTQPPQIRPTPGNEPDSDWAARNGKDGKCDRFLWPTSLIVIIAVIFQMFAVCMQLHREVSTGILDTMMAHGLTRVGYWLGNVLFDTIFLLIFPVGVVAGVHGAEVFQFTDDVGRITGLFFATFFVAFNALLICYLSLVVSPDLAVGRHLGRLMGVTVGSMGFGNALVSTLRDTGLALEHPGFPMLEALSPFYGYFTIFNEKRRYSRMYDKSAGPHLIMLVVYPVILSLVIAFNLRRKSFRNKYTPSSEGIPVGIFEDRDVTAELERVDECCKTVGRPADALACCHLWKEYPGKKVAVKGVTFGVSFGQCFGLLGSNGAGKSTTMRMLQMETDPSGGGVTYGQLEPGFTCSVERLRQLVMTGVCQQHDTLMHPLTGEDNIKLFLQLRLGPLYHAEEWSDYVRRIIQLLDLPPNRLVGAYSGGMKRKLATAIALFTGAEIVFLDEPSTGLDPFARRMLWRTITASLTPQTAVVLTTHSMDEADATCGKITIITEGLMRCIGSSQHLKSRFGTGYMATILLKEPQPGDPPRLPPEEIDNQMKLNFGEECKLAHAAGNLRVYSCGVVASPATAYRTLQHCATDWNLERFGISQATLQQVFVSFAQNVR